MSAPTGSIPPDPHGAAGPNGIIQTVNLRVAYWNKSGSLIWGPVALAAFWAGMGNTGTGLSDPRVIYDAGSERFVVITQENLTSGLLLHGSFLNVAVSRNSNPATSGAADWFFYRFDMTETSGGTSSPYYGGDYPGLGVDT